MGGRARGRGTGGRNLASTNDSPRPPPGTEFRASVVRRPRDISPISFRADEETHRGREPAGSPRIRGRKTRSLFAEETGLARAAFLIDGSRDFYLGSPSRPEAHGLFFSLRVSFPPSAPRFISLGPVHVHMHTEYTHRAEPAVVPCPSAPLSFSAARSPPYRRPSLRLSRSVAPVENSRRPRRGACKREEKNAGPGEPGEPGGRGGRVALGGSEGRRSRRRGEGRETPKAALTPLRDRNRGQNDAAFSEEPAPRSLDNRIL